jgi:hypothetical protein
MGMDFGERVSVALFVRGTANHAGSDYTGKSAGQASGDFSALIPGANVKVSIVGFQDSQEVRRTWIYARVGGGYAFFSPTKLLPDNEVMVYGGLGVEYFTRLRHFSLGLEITPAYMLTNSTLSLSVSPSVRYAF